MKRENIAMLKWFRKQFVLRFSRENVSHKALFMTPRKSSISDVVLSFIKIKFPKKIYFVILSASKVNWTKAHKLNIHNKILIFEVEGTSQGQG